jgi:O-antigen biosynthesis protein
VTSPLSMAELAAPVTVAEIELAEPATVTHVSVAAAGDGRVPQATVLVRVRGIPVGTVVVDAPGGKVDAAACAEAARMSLGARLRDRMDASSAPEAVIADPPLVSVVVATRERSRALATCLDSLAGLDYPNYEIVVVDNDPVTDETASLVAGRREPRLRYAREPRRGLAAAHNCGLEQAAGSIVAFTDDDVIVDRNWLMEIVRAFRADTNVACVTGLIMPAELQTQVQVQLETHADSGKGFEQRVFDSAVHRPADPLFPFTAGKFGSGANMAFATESLRQIGGFDPATGVGTVSRGGDELAAFFSVLAAGYSLVYQPSALVWHHHRRDPASLTNQAYGYGVGLGAYLTSVLVNHPKTIGRALHQAPAGLRYAFHPDSPRNARVGGAWPRHLVWRERRGIAFGPVAYGISRWRSRGARRPGTVRQSSR